MPNLEAILLTPFFLIFCCCMRLCFLIKQENPSVLLIYNFSSGYLNSDFILLNKVGSILGYVCTCQCRTKVVELYGCVNLHNSSKKDTFFFKLRPRHANSKDLKHSLGSLKWTHIVHTNNVFLNNTAPIPLLSP